ncbi:4'-phosphopantetheinyl transferase family protein [Streptomyces griseosporeus]|uniref:4'-phosphopantetheinyl transferase family protein n=1 Tax=Streptomyces griseosporeus TaxID=1910 RepID=UPI0036F5317A
MTARQHTDVLPRPSPATALMASLLPARAVAAEAFGDGHDEDWFGQLLPAEARLMTGAGEKRRRDFAGVRVCARRALRTLGHAPVPLLPGPRGEPRWPDGVVGSLTHCAGYRAAAVARPGPGLAGVGIDAEPHAPLDADVLEMVASPAERAHLALLARTRPGVHWGRLLFSVKEAVFKAWYPAARCELGFLEAEVRFTPGGPPSAKGTYGTHGMHGTVTATLTRAGPFTAVSGRWRVAGGVIATAVVI